MDVRIHDEHDKSDREIVVSANGVMLVRIVVEDGLKDTTIIMEQCGIGMIDGLESLQLLESEKTKGSSKLFGGHYGLGLKQLLAVLASLQKDEWNFCMFGTVHHDVSGQCGWSELWSSTVENQLTVHGNVSFNGLTPKVRSIFQICNNCLVYNVNNFIICIFSGSKCFV